MDLLKEACEEFCYVKELVSIEGWDVSICCYLLGECLDDEVEELKKEGF